MGIMVCSLLWVMQDLYHQPYYYEVPEYTPNDKGTLFPTLWVEYRAPKNKKDKRVLLENPDYS